MGTSLAVQWLRLLAPNAGGMSSISGWGIKILYATQHGVIQCKIKYKAKSLVLFFNLIFMTSPQPIFFHSTNNICYALPY